MKSNKVLTGLMAAALVAVPLAGCGAQAAETATADTASTAAASEAEAAAALIGDDFNTLDTNGVKLTFWHSMGGVNGEAMTALVDKFNQENQYGDHGGGCLPGQLRRRHQQAEERPDRQHGAPTLCRSTTLAPAS